ncbi:hypothetical protein NE237_013540 [Protea cynaroides]|uniref:Uncharacterized protein n=1 Tax=Protea cynaroides TaxID=273540 RepID=A0A9Q0H372_9MAGN|nr:hypothetical protein NE237_013540 [Protea cynaroides]
MVAISAAMAKTFSIANTHLKISSKLGLNDSRCSNLSTCFLVSRNWVLHQHHLFLDSLLSHRRFQMRFVIQWKLETFSYCLKPNDQALVFALATLLVLELRGAIPAGYWMQPNPISLTILSVLGATP